MLQQTVTFALKHQITLILHQTSTLSMPIKHEMLQKVSNKKHSSTNINSIRCTVTFHHINIIKQ